MRYTSLACSIAPVRELPLARSEVSGTYPLSASFSIPSTAYSPFPARRPLAALVRNNSCHIPTPKAKETAWSSAIFTVILSRQHGRLAYSSLSYAQKLMRPLILSPGPPFMQPDPLLLPSFRNSILIDKSSSPPPLGQLQPQPPPPTSYPSLLQRPRQHPRFFSPSPGGARLLSRCRQDLR